MQWIHVTFEPITCRNKRVFWNSNKEICLCCVFIVGLIRLKIRGSTSNASGERAANYGLPPNYFPKHLVSLGGSRQVNTKQFDYRYGSIQKNNDFTSSVNVYSPALLNVFLFEIHPSLCLASAVYRTESLQKLPPLPEAGAV